MDPMRRVDCDDRIHRRLENSRKSLPAVANCLLCPLSVRDVLDDDADRLHSTGFPLQWMEAEQPHHRRPCWGRSRDLDIEDRYACLNHSFEERPDLSGHSGRHLAQAAPNVVGDRQPSERRKTLVDPYDSSVNRIVA